MWETTVASLQMCDVFIYFCSKYLLDAYSVKASSTQGLVLVFYFLGEKAEIKAIKYINNTLEWTVEWM
jgi:hypothetical protein